MSTIAEQRPTTGLDHVKKGEGRPFDVVGIRFMWKAKGEDTQNLFTIAEQTLAEGECVPPHSHPYTEFFYVLEGDVRFREVERGAEEKPEILCSSGDSIIVRPGTIHTFYNVDKEPARILGVSNYLHQQFFDGVQDADAATPFGEMDLGLAMGKITELGRDHSLFFEPM